VAVTNAGTTPIVTTPSTESDPSSSLPPTAAGSDGDNSTFGGFTENKDPKGGTGGDTGPAKFGQRPIQKKVVCR
jgi:hypothetical protein